MANTFIIIEVAEDASGNYEPMGTKPKFWFHHNELGQCLYKDARPGTGEDWSEKIASELCALLGLPHARYELAAYQGRRGTVSPLFVVAPPEIFGQLSFWSEAVWGEAALFEIPQGSLVHGNELLFNLVPDYPEPDSVPKYRVSQHRLELVLETVSDKRLQIPLGWTPPSGINTAVETFIGYLLLDAWIGNTDRHHENWGVIEWNQTPSTPSERHITKYLAPTYDHASSLGCHETDEKRRKRLATDDQNFSVEAYAARARSSLYLKTGDTKPLLTFDAFTEAATRYPLAARIWLDRLAGTSGIETDTLFKRLPSERITETGIEFARKMLGYNRNRLLNLRSDLQ